ncbi:MAG: hypothetical protein ABL931_20965, partial [Usitatibacteraceae bacterium]
MIDRPNTSSTRFRLLRYFTLTGLAAFLLVAVPLIYVERQHLHSFETALRDQAHDFRTAQSQAAARQEEIARQDLMASQETANVNLTRVLANTLWSSDLAPFLVRAQTIDVKKCRAIADGLAKDGKSAPSLEKTACFTRAGDKIASLPGFEMLKTKVFEAVRKSDVFKVKVYDLRGITVFSS